MDSSSCLCIPGYFVICHSIAKCTTGLRKRRFINCSTNERPLLLHLKSLVKFPRLQHFRLHFQNCIGFVGLFVSQKRSAPGDIATDKKIALQYVVFFISELASEARCLIRIKKSRRLLWYTTVSMPSALASASPHCRYKFIPACAAGAVFTDNW